MQSPVSDDTFFCLSPCIFSCYGISEALFFTAGNFPRESGKPCLFDTAASVFDIKTSVKLWTVLIVCLKQRVFDFFFNAFLKFYLRG